MLGICRKVHFIIYSIIIIVIIDTTIIDIITLIFAIIIAYNRIDVWEIVTAGYIMIMIMYIEYFDEDSKDFPPPPPSYE